MPSRTEQCIPQVCAVSTDRAEAEPCCACAEDLGQWPNTVCIAHVGTSQQKDAAGLAAAVMVLEHVLMVRTKFILQIALCDRVYTYVLQILLEPVLLVGNGPTCQIAMWPLTCLDCGVAAMMLYAR